MKLRFAPSPTGYLHIGNARPALINWMQARRHGGEFWLRLDDTDLVRSRAEYAEAIEADLRWLGLDWRGPVRQSDRLARYAAAAERLKAAGRLYPCFESEQELQAKREALIRRNRPPLYDRAMLKLTAEQRAQAEANGKRPYWRFKLSDRAMAWRDLVLGPRQVKLQSISDPVLVREDGSPLYTFSSVVDDLEMGITHVLRGDDHVSNTGVQMDIWEALGGAPDAIRFGHLPMLVAPDGAKLSKRNGAMSLRSLRADGMEPSAVAAYLARLGTRDDPEPLPLEMLAAQSDLSRFSRSAARFDVSQMLALNRRTLHALAFEAVQGRLPEGATPEFWHAVRGNLDLLSEARDWWAVAAGAITPPVLEGEGEYLRAALAALPPEPWDHATWDGWIQAVKTTTGRRGKALFQPLRLALTGEDHGPELRELLPLIGRARAAERLSAAV